MSKKYTDQQFIDAVKNNFSVRNALKTLGLVPAGGSYKTFYSNVKRLHLDTSHFTGQAYLKGQTHSWNTKTPIDEVLIKDSLYTSSFHLKNRLVKEGLLDYKCSNPKCGLSIWLDEEISLHLDHINGDNTDNRIDNLRLLCPNCHSQTPTYCSKKK